LKTMSVTSKTFENTGHDTSQSPGTAKWIWIVPPFVIVGVLASLGVFSVAYRVGGALAILVALFSLPALFVLAFALRQALGNLLSFLSSMTWWHVLWMVTFANALVFRIRDVSEISGNPLDEWAIFRMALVTMTALILIAHLALRRSHWIGSMSRGVVGALTTYGFVCVASTVWSVFPSWTFYKGCEFLVDVALVAAIVESVNSIEDYESLFNWTWVLYGLLLISAWLGAFLWPMDALFAKGFKIGLLGFRLQGVMPALSANDVGTFAAILALLALCRLLPLSGAPRDRAWYSVLLASSIVTMIFSQTRSAIAGFLFGVFLILVFSKRKGLSAIITFLAAPILALSTAGGLIYAFLQRGQSEEQFATFSSRIEWWSFAWRQFLERPLTGFGAYAGGRFAVLAKMGFGQTSTMHSDYLEVIVGTSIWGLIPLIAALLGTWWLLFRHVRSYSFSEQERQLAYEGIAVLGLLTFRSIFMTMLTWHPPLHFLVILGYAELQRRRQQFGVAYAPSISGRKIGVCI
jgi:O-antigen ligase